jgi:TetR/AcrR family transcriptional regulator, transcriptional repressor for nem operon
MARECDTRQRLLDAAIQLVWESSYAAASVDLICQAAEVRKGSFYHFFESKSDLAIAALRADWESKKPKMDALFSPTVAPLTRLKNCFEQVYQRQAEVKKECGRVLGCPLFTLGCEISTQDSAVCEVVKSIIGEYQKYFESAIRDAHSEGSIDAPNAQIKARCLFSYFEGALARARIQNDVEPLEELFPTTLRLLGARTAVSA